VLLFATSNSNFIFDELLFDVDNSLIRLEDVTLDIVPTYEPTLEPIPDISFEPSQSPTVSPATLEPATTPSALEPTAFEPVSLEPVSLEPTAFVSATLEPVTLEPTAFDTPTQNPTTYTATPAPRTSDRFLEFYVTLELLNCTRNELNEYEKIVLLSSFAQITYLDIEYLRLVSTRNTVRRLFIENRTYTLEETIYVSIPLNDEYPPNKLYDTIVGLITESIQTGLLVDIIQSYNTSLFANIQIKTFMISEPVVRTESDNRNHINRTSLALIIVFSIMGSLFLFLLIFWVHSATNVDQSNHSIQSVNKVYALEPPTQPDISEESRVVEIANNECSL
jgi:hypothetical protein